MSIINSFRSGLPHIQLTDRSDTAFPARSKIYNSAAKAAPLAIALPQTAEDVAAIVKFASKAKAPITVRVGGHDLFGRCVVQDGIVIDIRSLNSVQVDKEACTAVIGGGVNCGDLSEALTAYGCTTPCPNIASVGYIGYATIGGYGPLAHKHGLGIDHLLSAVIVNANGQIVTADENEMKAIRGTAGNFGIIVSATIRIYPFSQILSGSLIFDTTSSSYEVAMNAVQNGMTSLVKTNDLPPELDVQPMYAYGPQGFYYGALFAYCGPDISLGRIYLEKVKSFHPVIADTVQPMTMASAAKMWADVVPDSSYMNTRAVNVRRVTPKIYAILVKACARMPADHAAMLTWHEVRPCSPSFDPEQSLPSVFNAREPHYVLEILSNCVNPANFETVSAWGIGLKEELLREAPEEVLDAQWLSSTPTSELGDLEDLYGEDNARFLRALKAEKDPQGVFRHALPSFDAFDSHTLNEEATNGHQ